MGKIRGTHSSPGIYTKITDLQYAAKSMGVTTLGLVGETLKGPAFEPIMIKDFTQFETLFGGTSAARFKDSLYPKYELPYIAKSYLEASDQLYVCRVLGLSGYNAGPAFVITASGKWFVDSNDHDRRDEHVVAILRSRGSYVKYANLGDECNPISKYDQLMFMCDEVELESYTNISITVNCDQPTITEEESNGFPINAINYGQFTIVAKKEGEVIGRYPVSLNPGAKDYIYNVLGSKPTEGSAALFVEELYDLNLKNLINSGEVFEISRNVTLIPEVLITPVCDPVLDFVNIPLNGLKRKNIGQTFICGKEGVLESGSTTPTGTTEYNGFGYYETNDKGQIVGDTPKEMEIGYIYKVQSYLDTTTGKKNYVYVQLKDKNNTPIKVGTYEIDNTTAQQTIEAVNVLSYDTFVAFRKNINENGDIELQLSTLSEMSDYHNQFRCASTPWFVSELKGDAKNPEVKKLFRFHTITDGTEANTQVKISISNVNPDEGTFDVLVRDFYDSDGNPTILESYKGLTMVPGTSKYIGLQIGTLDGAYEIKSNYVMVEVIENDMTRNCVPCGFLGYPTRDFSIYGLINPTVTYNTIYDDDIKEKRQYFGMSDLTGVDEDLLYYKGKNAYTEEYTIGYTNAFHLDSTLSIANDLDLKITIDGDLDTTGITWDTVSINNVTSEGKSPIIGSESDMVGTIYEDGKLRKFTACFYGGFDGWDIYRNSRTNTDEFKANKYKGTIINGYGQTFSRIEDGTQLALEGNCITSDYYAYLAGFNQFEQPERYRINLFATPGIDYVNNTLLVGEALDMVEEKRQDTFYVVTTPDKPWGSSDAIDEMYSAADAVGNLEDTGIDTYSMATSYPWVKFFDRDNNIYINLPATKDMLRNMANVDNKKYPWIAPAGITNGRVDCTKMHFFAKLEDEDTLYDGRINPLKSFSKDGVKIWGNKTMYSPETPMNRINIVRLLLYMKRIIIDSTRHLLFEPGDQTVVKQFESIVNPILAEIKNGRGISDYRLVTSMTPEQMDAHEMSAVLYVKPIGALEYIELNFVVTPQSVSFDSI
jgi:hypothetical protein